MVSGFGKQERIERFYKNMTIEENISYPDKAKQLVKDYYNALVADQGHPGATVVDWDQVYVVWFSKVLQNWKAVLGTTNSDGLYFEVTYNGDRKQTYIDHYVKVNNYVVHDEDPRLYTRHTI